MAQYVLIALVALLHFYFMFLEMFLWTKPQGLKVFRMTIAQAQDRAVLAANQGLYNGFLGAGLVWSILQPDMLFAREISIFFLACVIIAAAYGGYTVSRRIFFIQGVPALLALVLVLI